MADSWFDEYMFQVRVWINHSLRRDISSYLSYFMVLVSGCFWCSTVTCRYPHLPWTNPCRITSLGSDGHFGCLLKANLLLTWVYHYQQSTNTVVHIRSLMKAILTYWRTDPCVTSINASEQSYTNPIAADGPLYSLLSSPYPYQIIIMISTLN